MSETVKGVRGMGWLPDWLDIPYDYVAAGLAEDWWMHELTPGLTGWAQVNGRDELPIPGEGRGWLSGKRKTITIFSAG